MKQLNLTKLLFKDINDKIISYIKNSYLLNNKYGNRNVDTGIKGEK